VRFRTLLVPAAIATALAGCSALDVVGRTAITSFEAMLGALPGEAVRDGDRWTVGSPGGERFSWGLDFSAPGPDYTVSLDAAPFLAAGLDPARLPPDRSTFDAGTARLTISFEAGDARFTYRGEAAPLETLRKIVSAYRSTIGYHAALDHFGIALGDGFLFEWAKDLATNDKDVVFVLDPAPFIAAGVEPARIDGWTFAKIPVMDAAGRPAEVDKILKPYDLGR
jgi:hypothetical protein